MIISAPTALYKSILPQSQTDLRNVTWTISSNDPPRSKSSVFTLLRTEELRPLPDKIYDAEQRRVVMGEYVFNVSFAGQTVAGSGTKTFETGQVISFTDVSVAIQQINDLNVPDTVDFQQNTNVLDLSSLGLTSDEINQLTKAATKELESMINELNVLVTTANDLKSEIRANQKMLNEAQKAKEAAIVVFGTDSEIIDKLILKEQGLVMERDQLVTDLNKQIATANDIYQKILEVKEVVR